MITILIFICLKIELTWLLSLAATAALHTPLKNNITFIYFQINLKKIYNKFQIGLKEKFIEFQDFFEKSIFGHL
jgi:hypothetical protein